VQNATVETIDELRELIVRAAPDEQAALPVRSCSADEPLDAIIPFSSLILLGVVVAVEDRYGIRITRDQLAGACASGTNLRRLARMIEELRANT
jgi:acyl carrier protein